MSNVLIVIGSARQGRIADKIAEYVSDEVAQHPDATVTLADLKELDLPFFDGPITPSQPGYTVTNERVKKWQELVIASDVVVFLTPEYNRGLSAIQKNAIDWLSSEWEGKKAAIISYSWGRGAAIASLEGTLDNLKATTIQPVTHLKFMQDINPDGSFINEEAARGQIKATITDALA